MINNWDSLQLQDFIDVYLKEKEVNPVFNDQDLVGICMDFFEAGGETVGSTLAWVLMYMALYPEVQERCYKEIIQAIGQQRFHNLNVFTFPKLNNDIF